MEEAIYVFRREDNGELVNVPWSVMIDQDRAGFISLPDGATARRCVHREPHEKAAIKHSSGKKEIVSDAMGFSERQLADFEEDRIRHGFTDVEFVRDPLTPEFFQVKCESWQARDRYARHRGFVDRSRGSHILTQDDFDRAAELVKRTHHDKRG